MSGGYLRALHSICVSVGLADGESTFVLDIELEARASDFVGLATLWPPTDQETADKIVRRLLADIEPQETAHALLVRVLSTIKPPLTEQFPRVIAVRVLCGATTLEWREFATR